MSEKIMPEWARFGAEIRLLRDHLGISQAQVSRMIGYSPALVSKLELGTRAPKKDHVVALDRVFNTNGELLRKWSDIKRHEGDPDWYRKVVTSEERATEIRMYNTILVPGLLQTEAYARVIFADGQPLASEGEVEAMVHARLKRRKALVREGGPVLWALVDETAIRRVVGDEQLMAEQLADLVVLAESRMVKLQVIPESTRRHPSLSGPFRLLSFEDKSSLAYVEHVAGGELIGESKEVRRLTAIYGDLQGWALPRPQSLDLIREVRGTLDA